MRTEHKIFTGELYDLFEVTETLSVEAEILHDPSMGQDTDLQSFVEELNATQAAPETIISIQGRTKDGHHIGNKEITELLCEEKGIAPELASPTDNVCSIGWCAAEQKWYGWSHRAIYGFGIGDSVHEGDCTASSGWTDDYLAEHPGADKSLPVGFQAHTLDDAKRMAIAFADSVG